MTVENEINIDNCWKEIIKTMIDKSNNINDFTKEFLKLATELQHEENKNRIIAKYKMLENEQKK